MVRTDSDAFSGQVIRPEILDPQGPELSSGMSSPPPQRYSSILRVELNNIQEYGVLSSLGFLANWNSCGFCKNGQEFSGFTLKKGKEKGKKMSLRRDVFLPGRRDNCLQALIQLPRPSWPNHTPAPAVSRPYEIMITIRVMMKLISSNQANANKAPVALTTASVSRTQGSCLQTPRGIPATGSRQGCMGKAARTFPRMPLYPATVTAMRVGDELGSDHSRWLHPGNNSTRIESVLLLDFCCVRESRTPIKNFHSCCPDGR